MRSCTKVDRFDLIKHALSYFVCGSDRSAARGRSFHGRHSSLLSFLSAWGARNGREGGARVYVYVYECTHSDALFAHLRLFVRVFFWRDSVQGLTTAISCGYGSRSIEGSPWGLSLEASRAVRRRIDLGVKCSRFWGLMVRQFKIVRCNRVMKRLWATETVKRFAVK